MHPLLSMHLLHIDGTYINTMKFDLILLRLVTNKILKLIHINFEAAYAKGSNSPISNKGKVGISIASTIVLLLLLFLAYMLVTAKRKRTGNHFEMMFQKELFNYIN